MRFLLTVLSLIICLSLVQNPEAEARRKSGGNGGGRGTMDGGGGVYARDSEVSTNDVQRAILWSKMMSPMVLHYLEAIKLKLRFSPEIDFNLYSFDPSVLNALFPEPPKMDVFQKITTLEFYSSLNSPCHDEFGRKRAASAFPYDSPRICFDVSLIKTQAQSTNLMRRVLALALHEILHKMGLKDEKKAREFERLLNQMLPNDLPASFQKHLDKSYLLVSDIRTGSIPDLIESIDKQLNRGVSGAEICFTISHLRHLGGLLNEDFSASGLLYMEPLRAEMVAEKTKIWSQIEKLASYCLHYTGVRRPGASKRRFDPATNQVGLMHEDNPPPDSAQGATLDSPQGRENLRAELTQIRTKTLRLWEEYRKIDHFLQGRQQIIDSIEPQ